MVTDAREYGLEATMKNEPKPILATLIILALVAAPLALDSVLVRFSYSFACWRVCHPFGPDCRAYDRLIKMTTRDDIAFLVKHMNDRHFWWAEGLLCSWFPEALEPRGGYPQGMPVQEFWAGWWRDNKGRYENLQLHWGPPF